MADKRRMCITEALVELKLYDSKINKAIDGTTFVGEKKKSANTVGAVSVDAFNERAKAGYQSIIDLIKNRKELKAAIVQSNAVTKVTIAGVTYTVAEAIERKKSIDYEEALLLEMQNQWGETYTRYMSANLTVDNQVNKMMETFLGKDGDKSVKEDNYNAIAGPYRAKNEHEMVDPLGLQEKIQKLSDEIEEFRAEVDTKLSISNAITYIEV